MPNHFHFIIHANELSSNTRRGFGQKDIQEFSFQLGVVLTSYAHAINKQNKSTGSLFQQKTKSILICSTMDGKILERSENYFIDCIHCVHQNAWKAGIVKSMEDWPNSSFLDYCGLRNGTLCNIGLFSSLTGYDLSKFYQESCIPLKEQRLLRHIKYIERFT